MKNISEQYALYEEYSEICVDEKEYNDIIRNYNIPQNLQKNFFGKIYFKGTNAFTGKFANDISQQGEKVFLQDSNKRDDGIVATLSCNAYFFYEEYLIIVSVGEYWFNKVKSYGEYKEIPSIKPVIIPLNKIDNIEIKESTFAYSIKEYLLIMTFINKKKVITKLFRQNKKLESSDNWSFEVNKILLGLSNKANKALDNCEIIKGNIESLINNCIECRSTDKFSLNFYKKCIAKGVDNLKEKEKLKIFEILYKMEKIPTLEEAIKIYSIGREDFLNQNSIYEETDKVKRRNKLINCYNIEREIADIIGYDKYIPSLLRQMQKTESMAKTSSILSDLSKVQSQSKNVKLDPFLLGGLANGIAGPAVGFLTASNAKNQNKRLEIESEASKNISKILSTKFDEFETNYNMSLSECRRKFEKIKNCICDVENKNIYIKYLDCEIVGYRPLDKDILGIKIKINLNKNIEINNISFIIDGSLKINILENDEIIGNAFVNAPGYDIMNIEKVGFNNKNIYSAIGIVSNINSIENLKFEIEPYNLWIIEKG